MPKLRFPEFRAATDWKQIPLEDCLDYQQPTPYLVTDTKYSPAFKTPVLTAGKTFILGYTDEQHGIFSKGLPVIIFDDFTTATQFVDFPFKAKSSAMKILQAKNGADIKFMYETLRTISYEIGAHERHWISNFAPMLVSVPTPAEQEKIADCLTSVDELIGAQARKVDALKTHKNGLMQQLLPCEDETQPRLRFPEFQNSGEWEDKRLEDLAKRASGHTPSKSNPEHYNGGIKWVSLADSKRLDRGLISETTIEISEKGIENSSAVLHQAGTVLISRDAGVGKSAIMSCSMAVSQHFIVWTCDNHLLSNWFLYHLLQNSKPLFERAATGSTIKTIGLQFFIDLHFSVPSLREQQRIADCLTGLDDLIAAQTQKLEVFKTHKKGLKQQLFPSREDAL
jgi:type I restriction enzyme, S subunit